MPYSGPIIIIEDDADDQDLMKEILEELGVPNMVRFFNSCQKVLEYLYATAERPLLIISDINLPLMTGLQLRRTINEDHQLKMKSIPFVFLTTNPDQKTVIQAYDLMAQGYFIKPPTIKQLKEMVGLIIDYWKVSRHPKWE